MNHNQSEASFVIEIAPFTLKPDVDEATLIAASDELEAGFLSQQAGYISRDLVKGENGEWMDIVYWRSLAEAQAVMEDAMNSPICLKYFELMVMADPDDPSNGVKHFLGVKRYQPSAAAA